MNTSTFLTGVNYWPATQFIRMWKEYDPLVIEHDFKKAREYGLGIVRIFVVWEDFQPQPDTVDQKHLANLKNLLRIAEANNLKVIVTLLTGHMSGGNWFPDWVASDIPEVAAKTAGYDCPIVYDGHIKNLRTKNLYSDPLVVQAEELLIEKVVLATKDISSVWAYDLSNEIDNAQVPTEHEARVWQARMVRHINSLTDKPVINGIHIPELDGYGFPLDSLATQDLVAIHPYPMYNDRGMTNLSFVSECLEYVSRLELPILVEEFGVSTLSKNHTDFPQLPPRLRYVTEEDQDSYIMQVVSMAEKAGCLGAVVWCWSDYDPALFDTFPFNDATHERYFGIFRSNGEPKPVALSLQKFAAEIENKESETTAPELAAV